MEHVFSELNQPINQWNLDLNLHFFKGRHRFFLGFLSAHDECLGVPTRFLQKAGVDVALHLAKRLSTLRLEDATASVQKDKDMRLSSTRKLAENSGKFMEFSGLFGS